MLLCKMMLIVFVNWKLENVFNQKRPFEQTLRKQEEIGVKSPFDVSNRENPHHFSVVGSK